MSDKSQKNKIPLKGGIQPDGTKGTQPSQNLDTTKPPNSGSGFSPKQDDSSNSSSNSGNSNSKNSNN